MQGPGDDVRPIVGKAPSSAAILLHIVHNQGTRTKNTNLGFRAVGSRRLQSEQMMKKKKKMRKGTRETLERRMKKKECGGNERNRRE